jgi:hypothetical protein
MECFDENEPNYYSYSIFKRFTLLFLCIMLGPFMFVIMRDLISIEVSMWERFQLLSFKKLKKVDNEYKII